MDNDKIHTAINTDATPHHHRTLSKLVAFLDNIWHVLLTRASPYMLTSITLCQEKSGLVCEQHRSPLASCQLTWLRQTEDELFEIAVLNRALEQDIWVIRTLLLTCSLLSGQTPWLQWPSRGLVGVLGQLLNDAATYRWSDIGHPVG
jgi:hypothetical protein